MLERQAKVEVTSEVKQASPIAFGKWAATLAAIATPLCYLNGRAFHDGYLSRLHLESSMFPADVQGTFTDAARAWMEGAVIVLGAVSKALTSHWFLIIVLPTSLVIGLSAAVHYLIYRAATWRRSTPQSGSELRHVRMIRSILAPVCFLLLGAYVIYTLFALIGAVLLLSVGPFAQAGARVATNDLKTGFSNAPTAELSSPHAGTSTYRIIQCGDKFCALYREGEVATVPIAAITWASWKASDPALWR